MDTSKKHLPLRSAGNLWTNPKTIRGAFSSLFRKFSGSILAISYRDDGFPTPYDIMDLLAAAGRTDVTISAVPYQYVLSKRNGHEVLIVSRA